MTLLQDSRKSIKSYPFLNSTLPRPKRYNNERLKEKKKETINRTKKKKKKETQKTIFVIRPHASARELKMGERFPFFRKWTPATESRRNNETNPATGMFPGVRVGMRTHRGCASGNLFELTGKLKSCHGAVFGGEPGISHRTY